MNSQLKFQKFALALGITLALFSQATIAKTIYVKTNGDDTANGASWATAYKTVSRALQEASGITNDEIWIAAGTYKEGAPLTMKNNVGIYGGFAGTEKCKKQRVSGNETILDGNNAHRVFDNDFSSELEPLDDSAVLDSVTVANGFNFNFYDNGSGMYNSNASPTVTNCTFSGNQAASGGGMFNYNASPTVTNCTFSENEAYYDGGGMFNTLYSNPTVINCTFSGNFGGGMYNYNTSLTVTNCTFSENDGGGMINEWHASPTITNCTFSRNSGNGMYNSRGTPAVTNCTFSGNSYDGMHNYMASPTVTNCTFSGNDNDGMYNYMASPAVTNCTFSGNSASRSGGGMFNSASSPTVTNCIFWGNTYSTLIYNGGISSAPQVTYSIVQGGYVGTGNIDADPLLMQLADYGGLVPSMPVRAGSPAIGAGTSGAGVPAEDAIGQTRMSPCTMGAVEFNERLINITVREGTSVFTTTYAFTLEVRSASTSATYQWFKNGTMIDGATGATYTMAQSESSAEYHCQVTIDGVSQDTASVVITAVPAKVIHVSKSGSDTNDGSTWENARASVRAALEVLGEAPIRGTEIWIAEGIYHEGEQIRMKNNVGIYGGFAGNETAKGQRVVGKETVLDGNKTHRVFYNDFSRNSPLTSSAVLDTVTVANAYMRYIGSYSGGGGMYNYFASPTITNCTFRGNRAFSGGGMYNSNASPTIIYCTFSENEAYDNSRGGGIYNDSYSSPNIENCTFNENKAMWGAGIYEDSTYRPSSTTITNCTFRRNAASRNGGGIHNSSSSPTIANCTFSGNTASAQGGGIYNWKSDSIIVNCTFNGNSVSSFYYGSGIYNHESHPTIVNSIVWGNTPVVEHGQIFDYNTSKSRVDYSIVQGGFAGTGNRNVNPWFAPLGNHGGLVQTMPLEANSPAIGIGATQAQVDALYGVGVVKIPTKDAIGTTRNTSLACTVGAVEYNFQRIYVAKWGNNDNDGSSWNDAKLTVSAALAIANAGYEIWIAAGTYGEDTPLRMKNEVAIYGGFAGNELNKNSRPAEGAASILCGNNTHRVFENIFTTAAPLTSSAVLDSLTIRNGRSDSGGGMYNNNASPTIRNSTFRDNTASWSGGAMRNENSSPVITDCLFMNNIATNGGAVSTIGASSSLSIVNCTFTGNMGGGYSSGDGGAMNFWAAGTSVLRNCTFENNFGYRGGAINTDSTNISLIDCTFFRNDAWTTGGAIRNLAEGANRVANITLLNCTFEDNWANTRGGGLYNFATDRASIKSVLTDCRFIYNTGGYGGAMFNSTSSGTAPSTNAIIDLELANCTFTGNRTATNNGGGIYNYGTSDSTVRMTLHDCTFSQNTARSYGGAMDNTNATATITNCIFFNNTANYGGAMYNYASSPVVTHCTFEGNRASVSGNGMYSSGSSTSASNPKVTNCILWGDVPQMAGSISTSSPVVSYSIVKGYSGGMGNFDEDPLLVQAGHVHAESPAIGLGATQEQVDAIFGTGEVIIPDTDALGQTRNTSQRSTAGAVEHKIRLAVQEGKNNFASAYEFMLEVSGWLPGATFQWYKNGEKIEGETNATLTISQMERSASYYCVVTLDGTPMQSLPVTITTVELPIVFNVYETKIAARTSVIREMSVRVMDKRIIDGQRSKTYDRPVNVKIHYRAPVSVNYTIQMAFNDDAAPHASYTNTGYGRMWSSSKEEKAYEFGGQWMIMNGQAADEGISPIGVRGLNIPIEALYHNDDANAPSVTFKGLATFEKDGARIFSYVGIARGENFYPARATKTPEAEQGLETDGANGLDGYEMLGNVYYPQPCFEEGILDVLKPAHFFGTFTTRFNKSLSGKEGEDWTETMSRIDNRVPTGK